MVQRRRHRRWQARRQCCRSARQLACDVSWRASSAGTVRAGISISISRIADVAADDAWVPLETALQQRRTAAGVRRGNSAPVRLALEDGGERVRTRFAAGTRVPGEHLVTARSRTPRCPRACRPACPRACSGRHVRGGAENHAGLRHARTGHRRRIVQRSRRCCRAGSIAFAKPKSSTFTVPSARTLMLAGFRSRWMMPCSCAASSASAICFAIGSASSSGIGAARDAIRERRRPRPAPSRARRCRRSLRGRRCARCSDGSARRALRLRAGSGRGDRISRDRRRQDLDRDWRFSFVSSRGTPRPCRPRRSGR